MECIVYKTETGISIIHPVKSVESAMKDIPEGSEYKIIDESEIPSDRTFRGAWTFDFKEDIVKAKEIWKFKLRNERVKLLEDLDANFMKALETGSDAKEIVAEKQRLRDITKLVDNCKTIDEIKSVSI